MSAKFFKAIQHGDRETVGQMIAANPKLLHAKARNGLSPILAAAYYRQPEIADMLADHTVAISIFEAAATGRTKQIVLFLAKQPELVNAYAPDGFQPLGLASFFGHQEAVEYLLKAGAWVNAPSKNEQRVAPLHSAVASGYIDIAYRLLEAGADPNLRQQGDFTPLHAAAQNGQIEMIRLLLNYGADLQVRNKAGKTALDLAAEKGHTLATAILRAGITRRFHKTKVMP